MSELKQNDVIIRALDALNFDAGDWKPENIERHLREQIDLAKEILNSVAEPAADTTAIVPAQVSEGLADEAYEAFSTGGYEAMIQLLAKPAAGGAE